MNSEQIQAHLDKVSRAAQIPLSTISLLNESLACFLGILALSVDAISEPSPNLLGLSTSLLLLSNAANNLEAGEERDSVDYLVGMGFEQSGELLTRVFNEPELFENLPINNVQWYRLTLAMLHYLAGGFRVQAFSVIQNLRRLSESVDNNYREAYRQSYSALRRLYADRSTSRPTDEWEQLLFSDEVPVGTQRRRIYAISQRIRLRRQATLAELGFGNEENWLMNRGIENQDAARFWMNYLRRLDDRGITSFTEEQRGTQPGFELWLQLNRDLLVILPTGAGKTIIGELKTALAMSIGKQVIWILPTRSLVRQTRYVLTNSFRDMGVTVEELPTTEDFQPLFADELATGRYIAVTTPEKLAALIRTRPDSISNIGLVVFDEAQNLFDVDRGATFESVIQSLNAGSQECSFVLMSAMSNSDQRLRLFMNRLRPNIPFEELISDNRPTRRVNGVLTNQESNRPIILCYPPGLQSVDGITVAPFSILFNKIRPTQNNTSVSLSQKVLRPLTNSKFRSVLFVSRTQSTISQTRQIARVSRYNANLPSEDIDRLCTELGRESVVVEYGARGVVPHHGGLAPVEQHMIERWIRDGLIRTVVATPTLAQGINLPFDISLVSFLQRFNTQTRSQEELSLSEIMNMLGRAGRAGYVSDGLSLIASPRGWETPVSVLDKHRKYYFQRSDASSDFLGLSRLMIKANNTNIDDSNWLYELGNMGLSDVQALVSFSLRVGLSGDNLRESLATRLQLFPSIQDLREYFGDGFDILDVLSGTLEPLVENIMEECGDDTPLLDALMRTGMPLQMLRRYFDILREPINLERIDASERIAWADQVVLDTLSECNNREWYLNLFENDSLYLQNIFEAVVQWRSGIPLQEIEDNWEYRSNNTANQIAIGKFFNHKISLLAQFWGALSVCEEIVYEDKSRRLLENIQLYVREGVNSISQLVWLKRTGGLDRVLAHHLAATTPSEVDRSELNFYIQRQINSWRANRSSIPVEISNEKLGALVSILNEY